MSAGENESASVFGNPNHVEQLEQAIKEHGDEWLRAADGWIRRNPYLALGIAVGVGCTIAACLRNRDRLCGCFASPREKPEEQV